MDRDGDDEMKEGEMAPRARAAPDIPAWVWLVLASTADTVACGDAATWLTPSHDLAERDKGATHLASFGYEDSAGAITTQIWRRLSDKAGDDGGAYLVETQVAGHAAPNLWTVDSVGEALDAVCDTMGDTTDLFHGVHNMDLQLKRSVRIETWAEMQAYAARGEEEEERVRRGAEALLARKER